MSWSMTQTAAVNSNSRELYDLRAGLHESRKLCGVGSTEVEFVRCIPKADAKSMLQKRAYDVDSVRYVWRRRGQS